MAFVGGLVVLMTSAFFMRSRRRPVETGAEQMLREIAIATESFEHTGFVRVRGELWRANSATPVQEGQQLRIVKADGLTLEVVPYTTPSANR